MRKRYFGGIISSVKPVTTSSAASGLFTNSSAIQLKAAGNWPSVATGNEMYIPPETTQLLGLKFNNGTLTLTGTYTVTSVGTLTYVNTGGIQNTGYATGWTMGSKYLTVTNLSTVAATLNKTYVAWYKGTQTNTGGSYSPSIPIFGDPTNNVYWGLGISGGKVCVANSLQRTGQTLVNTGQWFCLAWAVKSGGTIDAFVNGIKELTNISVNTTYPGTSNIGNGYAYAGTQAPTAIDAVQIFDGILTTEQLATIYTQGAAV